MLRQKDACGKKKTKSLITKLPKVVGYPIDRSFVDMGTCSSQEHQPSQDFEKTPKANNFEVLAKIGVGSFAEVTLCRWVATGDLYAVKKIEKQRLFRRCDHSALIWNERDAMIRSESPFCVELKCAYQTEQQLFLVMPFYLGGDLLQLVKQSGALHPHTVQFYLAEMMLGLEAIHSKVHFLSSILSLLGYSLFWGSLIAWFPFCCSSFASTALVRLDFVFNTCTQQHNTYYNNYRVCATETSNRTTFLSMPKVI